MLLVPGFMAGDGTLKAMSHFLRAEGFRTYRAQIHVNAGCTREAADRLERRLESIAIRRDRKVTIVGHSLGGMLARGLAARRPDLVEGIVAMGSPVLAPGAIHRLLAWDATMLAKLTRAGVRGLMSEDCVGGECARLSWEESQAPLHPDVAFTAIYSQRDGIVDWRACLDPARPSGRGAHQPLRHGHRPGGDGRGAAPRCVSSSSRGPAGRQVLTTRRVRSASLACDRGDLDRTRRQPLEGRPVRGQPLTERVDVAELGQRAGHEGVAGTDRVDHLDRAEAAPRPSRSS